MYAIMELGGRQWKVEQGSRLDVNRLSATVGAAYTVEQVLFAHDGTQAQVGRPYIPGAKVVCEVLEHRLGSKVISFHFRRRENWRKKTGHRQRLTRLLVKEITLTPPKKRPLNAGDDPRPLALARLVPSTASGARQDVAPKGHTEGATPPRRGGAPKGSGDGA